MALLLARTLPRYRPHAHRFYNVTVTSLSSSACTRQQQQQKSDVTISKARDESNVSTDVRPLGERVKENTKTASYFGVILGGVVVTGAICLAICKELFSSSSSNSVYSDALQLCVEVITARWTSNQLYSNHIIYRNAHFSLLLSPFLSAPKNPRLSRHSNQRLWRGDTKAASPTRRSLVLREKRQEIHSHAVLHTRHSKQGYGALRKRLG